MRSTLTYWACPDEAEIARCFTAEADPVAALAEAKRVGLRAIEAAKQRALDDAHFAGCKVTDIREGEPLRNPRDWADTRIWYPLMVDVEGSSFAPPMLAVFTPPEMAGLIASQPAAELLDAGFAALAAGDFKTGWPLYEYRWQVPQGVAARRPFAMPMWDGVFREGMTLLAHTAQGYGDAIMFARYLPWLNGRADLLSFDTLTPLLQTIKFFGRVMSHQDIRTEYDYHVPLCSLPLLLDPKLTWLPCTPYLYSDIPKCWLWRKRIGEGGFNVGICWAGSEAHLKNGDRSMSLETVLAHCPKGARLFSLQKGEPAQQLRYLPDGVDVTDWTAELYDWSDTAALVDCLDLIVSVDTAIVHLAGALNRPVKLLLGDKPEWRWAPDVERGRSRWYSSVEFAKCTPS